MRSRNFQQTRGQVGIVAKSSPFVSPSEVAEILGRDPRTIRKMIKHGHLPGRKLGNEWVMTRAEWAAELRRLGLSHLADSVNTEEAA